jgi:hypothetical protein
MHMRPQESNSASQDSHVTPLTTTPQSLLWLNSRNITLLFTPTDFETEI